MLLYKPTGGDSTPELVIYSMSDQKKQQTNNQNTPPLFPNAAGGVSLT